MDSEMQFGELEEAAPRTALRPDQNRHFAVCSYGQPVEDDLPVFIDLDALQQMEYHALSNVSVELGGVMLGGQFVDGDGRPFVLVTDVLPAEHYESTKGSFKFTHDTWSEITRQMQAFPEDMQIVGWYHTHPDWGVFLSGMDMFICENFFNKPLDVAFVIDPCRGDRGMFFWRPTSRGDKQRTSGFYVVASRFREEELEYFVQQLEEQSAMSTRSRTIGAPLGSSAPVVHFIERNSSPLMSGIIGMLVMQFCLLALLAWRMGVVPVAEQPPATSDAAEVRQVLNDWLSHQQRVIEAEAKLHLVDQLLAQTGQGDAVASEIAKRELEISQLQASLSGLNSSRLTTEKRLEETVRAQQAAEKREKTLKDKLERESKKLEQERIKVSSLEEELAKLHGDAPAKSNSFAWLGNSWITIASVIGSIAILGIGAIVAATVIARRQAQPPIGAEEPSSYSEPPR